MTRSKKAPAPAGAVARSILFAEEDLAALEVLGQHARITLGLPEAASTQAELVRLGVRSLVVRAVDRITGTADTPERTALVDGLERVAPGALERWSAYSRALGL